MKRQALEKKYNKIDGLSKFVISFQTVSIFYLISTERVVYKQSGRRPVRILAELFVVMRILTENKQIANHDKYQNHV